MICAIYARKSTDDSDRDTEARSTARQVQRATQYAEARGWTVVPRNIFVDEAVCGAEWRGRPGLARLLASLDHGAPPFRVLVVSEFSRIGRDSVRVPYTVQLIEEAGVQIHSYLSGQRISVDDELGEMQTMLHALAASFERRRARQRTYDALLVRARRGYVTGGKVYGYVNRPVLQSGRRSHVERSIEPREAAVVRRIFEHAAEGWGVKRISAALNAEAAPPPVPRRPGQRPGWAPSSVREILHRELYRGVAIWGRTQKVVRRGTKHQRDVSAGQALRVDVPALRIVDETLWRRAHERLDAGRALYLAVNKGKGFGRPPSGRESPYLLTGLGTCAICGGSMCVLTRASARAVLGVHDP
jgi:site-specific DNA recombinase